MRDVSTLLVLFLLWPLTSNATPASYRLHVPSVDASHVEVEARFALNGDVIGMYVIDAPSLENGSADLVEGLRVERADGTVMAVENLGVGDWKLKEGRAGDEVVVRYRVALRHGEHVWGPGIDEVAYRTDDGLFFAGRALWIVPFDGLADGATIEFDLPDPWRASTPWPEVDGRPTASLTTLISNCFFVGTHHEETVRFEDFTFVFALGRDLAESTDLFAATMRPVLPRAKALFGGMPDQSRYLVVINRHGRADGGAYSQSYSLLVEGTVNEASSVVWGHGIVHELLHFWNGHTLKIAGTDEEWFKEGVTDYLTVLLRSRLGQDRPEVTLRKFENALRRVALSRMMMGNTQGLDTAGAQKQQNRMLVYGGGLLTGLALDLELRRATGDAHGLATLLQRLYVEFAREGRRYTTDDVQRVAGAVAGASMEWFFDKHVRGGVPVDFRPVFTALGLQLDTFADEFYLSPAPAPSPEVVRTRRSILGW